MSIASTRACRRVAGTLAVAAALSASCAVHAGTVEPELGLGYATGSAFDVTGDTDVLQWGLGYSFDNGIGARVMGFGNLDPFEGWFSTVRTFDNFLGVQAMDRIALGDQWAAMLAAGLGRTHYNLPEDSTQSAHETEGIVTVGLRWKPAKHFAMSLQYSYLTQSGVGNTALMCQVPF